MLETFVAQVQRCFLTVNEHVLFWSYKMHFNCISSKERRESKRANFVCFRKSKPKEYLCVRIFYKCMFFTYLGGTSVSLKCIIAFLCRMFNSAGVGSVAPSKIMSLQICLELNQRIRPFPCYGAD